MMIRLFKKITLLLVVFCLAGVVAHVPDAHARKDKIVRVLGPTHFQCERFQRLRLVGIRVIPGMDKYVKSMLDWRLKGKVISFKRDKRIGFDSGGWQLVDMYVPNTGWTFSGSSRYYDKIVIDKKTVFLNAYLVSQGYAMPDGQSSNKKNQELYQQLYEEAKRNKVGAWQYVDKKGRLRLKR